MTFKICLLSWLSVTSVLAGGSALQPTWATSSKTDAPTVVLIGGLKGKDASSAAIEQALHKAPKQFNVAAVPVANAGGETLVFPPAGTAYRENGQSHFIWRWLGLHGVDLVVVVGDEDYGLTDALSKNAVANVGTIPAVHAKASADAILHAIPKQVAISEAHKERDRRLARTPRQLDEELAKYYGHELDSVVYIPVMALISRLRMGDQADVVRLVEPYVNGTKDSLAKMTASHPAGHLIFAELAERTGDKRYIERVRAAADVATKMHNEMSDSVFMGCPILAAAGKLTGDTAYFDKALAHLKFMQGLCLRSDGIYRHSPLSEAAWGRGNAFPALGLSWTLLYMPKSHPGYAVMVKNFQDHMAALAKYQDRDGMWHEVVDQPGSYAEFSATAMIATAMLRGVKHGWLDHSYEDRARAAWRAVLAHVGPEGALVDVCESTGKQKSVEDYLNRAASFGKDQRGGGMAMLLATEMPQ